LFDWRQNRGKRLKSKASFGEVCRRSRGEPATTAWFAIRLGPSTFGIFDAFPDETGRQAHLSGQVATALMAKASELLAQAPVIEKIDVLAAKLPR
jgi:quinol monooxygenase YgiN